MIIKKTLLILLTLFTLNCNAQNLQSVTHNRNRHSELLAKQTKVKDQIKSLETQKYIERLLYKYEEAPEIDIYSEGWESNVINCYKNSIVPNSKSINVKEFCLPVKSNYITSPYGYRAKFKRNHYGIDLRAAIGDTVRSVFSGKVRLTKFDRSGYGFYVIIRHNNGLETVYGHLSRFLVQPNQEVKVGQPIALSGNTGHSTGPHLHFETRFMGYAINPEGIFDFKNRVAHTDIYTFTKSTYKDKRSFEPTKKGKLS